MKNIHWKTIQKALLVKAIILAILFYFPLTSIAMDMPIKVSSTSEDIVGQRLVYAIKDSIEKSSSMHITYENEVSLGLSIVTLEGDNNRPGSFTTYSVTWIWNNPDNLWPFFLTSSVGQCGTKSIDQCAHGLVSQTHEQVERIINLIKVLAEPQENTN